MLRKRMIEKPRLSGRAFWDTEISTLDFTRHSKFIISRVFERGSDEDKTAIINYYGDQQIIKTLTSMSSLMPLAIERAKQAFHLSDTDFACYTSKQRAPNYSKY